MDNCPKCGAPVAIGEWPFCPHGIGHSNIITDDIPGGQVIENLGHQPETFYSKQAIVKEADRRGLQPMVRYVDGDKHLTNWAASIDPYPLAAAAALVARRAERSQPEIPDTVVCESAAFTINVLEAPDAA